MQLSLQVYGWRGHRLTSPALLTHRPLDLALTLPLRDRLTLLVLALAAADPELDLRDAVREVDAQGNDREALLLLLGRELVDLATMEQELARPGGEVALHV